jgi:hypothetical protein
MFSRHIYHTPRLSQAAELHKKLSQRMMRGSGGAGEGGESKGGAASGVDVKRVQWLQLQVIVLIHCGWCLARVTRDRRVFEAALSPSLRN